MRAPKTADQVEAIEMAQRAAEAAFAEVVEYLKKAEKPTSEEAHAILDKVLASMWCESPEGHIVSHGVRSADPHEKGTGIIEKRVPIVIDIYPCATATGYFADMSRTVCLGAPPEELVKMYDAVLKAQELAESLARPGARCVDIHLAVDDYFQSKGYVTSGIGSEFPFSEGFVHSLGHGVGKDIHEAPRIGRNSEDILQEGDVITIEPGLYYHHIGGVRLEDMVLITGDGCRNLTRAPKVLAL